MHTHEPNRLSSSSSSSFSYSGSVFSSPLSTQTASYVFDHFSVRSWRQLLLGGGGEEEDQGSFLEQPKKLESWEEQVLNLSPSYTRVSFTDVKQELAQSRGYRLYETDNRPPDSWYLPASSPSSFRERAVAEADGGLKNNKRIKERDHDHSLECNNLSCATDGATNSKKARVHQSSVQPALKVRKERLGDKITALHQLVSPFGKTDTASVLSEAIGYIRFLESQIHALSSPYMRNHKDRQVQERSSPFTQNGGQESSEGGEGKDLKNRGLCLVPISCTQHVENDNGADYWSLGGGGGF